MNALDNKKYSGISDGEYDEIEDIDVKLKGKGPDEGTITIEKGNVKYAFLCINGYNVEYDSKKAEVKDKCNPGVKLIEKINKADTTSTLDSITIPINVVNGTTITAKAIDEDGNEITGTVENGVVKFSGLKAGKNYRYEITATDSSGNETIRKGTLTTVSFNHIDIKQDTNEWAKKKTITITTEENLNGTGTELQYKIGTGNWTKYTNPFEITSNTAIYARLKNGENISDEETLTITKIDNVTIGTPIATVAAGGYPKLTSTGIESSNTNTLKITYTAQEGTSAYYSLDNGTTWKKYTNEVSVNTSNVKAKLKRDVSGLEGNIVDSTIDSSGVNDAIGVEAYDGDFDTFIKMHQNTSPGNNTRYMLVDNSAWNKYIYVKWWNWNYSGYFSSLTFFDSDNHELAVYKLSPNVLDEKVYIVPENSVKVKYYVQFALSTYTPDDGFGKLYEITISPKIVEKQVFDFATITSNGIKDYYSKVEINYPSYCNKKLYKINDGEWINYNGSVNVLVDKSIYAKCQFSNGKYSGFDKYDSKLQGTDYLPIAAYDNDEETYFETTKTHYINVDSSMIGKEINFYITNAENENNYQPYVSFLDSNGTRIGSELRPPKSSKDNYYVIPEGTKKISYKPYNPWGYNDRLVEIYIK